MTCKDYFRCNQFGLAYITPADFVHFNCGCHKLYVFWRIFWALYHLVWIVLTGVYSYQWAGHDPDQQIKWFIYLTDWAYFVLTLSTLIDAICVVFISIKRDDIIQDISPIMPWYLKVDWVFFNISNTISVLMSVMYWGLIYDSSADMTAVNIETHALNMVYVIINLFMTGIPVRFYHFFHPMIFGIIYVVFSVIYEVSGGTNHQNKSYIYSVLDWSNTTYTTMLSLIVVLVAIPFCHFIMFIFHLIRIYLNKHCCSRNKKSVTIVTPEGKGHPAGNSLQMNYSNEVKVDMETNKMEDEEFSSKPNDHHMENENETNAKQETTHEQIMKTTVEVDLEEEKIDKENVDEENNIKPN